MWSRTPISPPRTCARSLRSSRASPCGFPAIRSSSCGWPPKRCSSRGTGSAPSTTATRRASLTTSVPPSTSRRWSSGTWATTRRPVSPCPATPPPARTTSRATTSSTPRERTSLRGSARRSGSRRWPMRCRCSTTSSPPSPARSKRTIARCRTWSSPWSAESSGCSRPATGSAPRRRRSASPSISPMRASSRRQKPSCESSRSRSTSSSTRSSRRRPKRPRRISLRASTSHPARRSGWSPSMPTSPRSGRRKRAST